MLRPLCDTRILNSNNDDIEIPNYFTTAEMLADFVGKKSTGERSATRKRKRFDWLWNEWIFRVGWGFTLV